MRFLLIVQTATGEFVPAIPSVFPQVETSFSASSCRTRAEADNLVAALRNAGQAVHILVLET